MDSKNRKEAPRRESIVDLGELLLASLWINDIGSLNLNEIFSD